MMYGKSSDYSRTLQATASGHYALQEAMSLERSDRKRILTPGGPMAVAFILLLCLTGGAAAARSCRRAPRARGSG